MSTTITGAHAEDIKTRIGKLLLHPRLRQRLPELWLARIIGSVSRGVIMNSLVVELPEGRGGTFLVFALPAATYAPLCSSPF